MPSPTPSTGAAPVFPLLWTVGFSGKRQLDPAREIAVARALGTELERLVREAARRNSRLTAVSSLARGGDVLFAEAVEAVSNSAGGLPWKALLPFAWEDFLRLDLEHAPDGRPLPQAEQLERRGRAEACLARSTPRVEAPPACRFPLDQEAREEAYLECGYRTVDESDVMIFLLRSDEIEKLRRRAERSATPPSAPPGAGTFAVACYALAAGQPMVVFDADAPDVGVSRQEFNEPRTADGEPAWFVDPVMSDLVLRASRMGNAPAADQAAAGAGVAGATRTTPSFEAVGSVGEQLGRIADQHQGATRGGYRSILRFHLASSSLAAVAATIFSLVDPSTAPVALLAGLAAVSLLKPLLAGAALWVEHTLHRKGTRDSWLYARVLAELCRGARATWPLPTQPLDAQDEEDFPKVKRMIRTLRLLREQDPRAAIQGTPPNPGETAREADMRVACDGYRVNRLQDQARYYEGQLKKARASHRAWRKGFLISTGVAILAGLVLALDRFLVAGQGHLLGKFPEHVLEAVVIIAPFAAAHCLGTMSILDTNRRCRRYGELQDYLQRLDQTLGQTTANPSRIRLVEHAERTLIEEQHEWFSVMRNTSV